MFRVQGRNECVCVKKNKRAPEWRNDEVFTAYNTGHRVCPCFLWGYQFIESELACVCVRVCVKHCVHSV